MYFAVQSARYHLEKDRYNRLRWRCTRRRIIAANPSFTRSTSPRTGESPFPVQQTQLAFHRRRTMKRPASLRSAATTQNCRPSSSVLEIEPQRQPTLRRLSAMISQYFTNSTSLVVVLNRFRRKFVQFKLCVHFLHNPGLSRRRARAGCRSYSRKVEH
jgi:hypothetical protein